MAGRLRTFLSATGSSGSVGTGVGCLHWRRAPEEEEELQTGSQGQ